jgi:hypothetical protein
LTVHIRPLLGVIRRIRSAMMTRSALKKRAEVIS